MRVTPNTMRYEALYRINWQMEQMRDLTDKISSGKALRAPSDGPVDVAMSMRYRSRLADYETFEENIQKTTDFLQEVDLQLGKLNSLVQRSRDIALQGANGTFEENSREAIGQEVEQIYEEMVRTANASIDGRYIFAGNKTGTKPFTEGYDGNDEVILYKGDNGIRSLEIGENAYIEENIPGSELFYPSLTTDTRLENLRNGVGIEAGTIRITDGTGASANFDIIVDPLDPNRVETVGEVLDKINNSAAIDVYARLNEDGTGIVLTDQSGGTASVFKVEDTAGRAAEQLGILRESLDRTIDGKPIDSAESIFITIRRLKDALYNNNDIEIYEELIGDITDVQQRLLLGRAKAGTRIRTLETMLSSNQQTQLALEEQLFSREDLDASEAILEMQQHQTVYQMALASAARSLQTTLLNYL